MIAHLAQKHSVVVASLAHNPEELEEGTGLKEYCDEIIVETVPERVRWRNAIGAMPTSTPSSVAYFRSARLHRRVGESLQRNRFDVVMVHCAFVAQYVETADAALRILDYGDMDSAKWREYAQHRNPPLGWGYALEARKLQDYERRMAAKFDYCSVTTHGELEEFETLRTGIPCRVIPNGVDTSYFAQGGVSTSSSPVIVFVGRMDYFPNIDAACYFVEDVLPLIILPLIRTKIPTVRFLIVGSNPSRRVRDLAKTPGVVVTGHVPDVRVYMKDSAVSVAPLRIARGTQNKILESMSMGLPVVASPQAAKGIQATPGRHILVAEHPQPFANTVLELLSDESLRTKVSISARAHLDHAHTWRGSMQMLDELLEEGMRRSRAEYAGTCQVDR
jgi:sugar transferase (PEP-CTERM/EpsH1 system associated)